VSAQQLWRPAFLGQEQQRVQTTLQRHWYKVRTSTHLWCLVGRLSLLCPVDLLCLESRQHLLCPVGLLFPEDHRHLLCPVGRQHLLFPEDRRLLLCPEGQLHLGLPVGLVCPLSLRSRRCGRDLRGKLALEGVEGHVVEAYRMGSGKQQRC
jgi:hypothetical protein